MPIYKGNKEITAIYKGDTPISAIYKGDTLIFSSGTWEEYLYELIYNSLVPTTINNKQVKNKARVNTIYANGVIENQHFNSFRTITVNGCTITPLASGKGFHIQGTAQANSNTWVVNLGSDYTRFANHKMLIKNNSNIVVRNNDFGRSINQIGTITGQYFVVDMVANTVYDDDVELQLFDLTQRYGTGNEPTSLSDNRIQKILNSGYMPYNTGTYKGTNISEISSEPYNLFDGDFEGGYIDSTTGELKSDIVNRARSKNFIKVVSGKPYTISSEYFKNVGKTTMFRIFEYDENRNYLGIYYGSNNSSLVLNTYTFNFTLSNSCRFIKFDLTLSGSTWTNNPPSQSLVQLAFHITGTRTGYAPHKTLTPIALKYQGNGALNSHDTLEITSTEYVFTKNTFKITLSGSETVDNLTQHGTNFMGITNLFATDTRPPLNYLPMFNKRVFNNGSINNLPEGYCYTYGRNFYYNIGTNDQQANIDFITGLEVIYQLATPQVIRIPRKHLGVVKVRDLSWSYDSSFPCFLTTSLANIISKPTTASDLGNIYISQFLSIELVNLRGKDLKIALNSNGNIRITDNSCSNTTDFLNKYGDYYIFYETKDEVDDMPFIVEVESGGTITTDNEVLPNIEFDIKCK